MIDPYEAPPGFLAHAPLNLRQGCTDCEMHLPWSRRPICGWPNLPGRVSCRAQYRIDREDVVFKADRHTPGEAS